MGSEPVDYFFAVLTIITIGFAIGCVLLM